MFTSIFLLWLMSIPFTIYAIVPPRDYYINCGSSGDVEQGPIKYTSDRAYISTGNETTLKRTDIYPLLQTLRYFPDSKPKKYCFTIPVIKGGKYLIKTVYFYGGFDGKGAPPVFDQIIDGTKWSVVNTTEDYVNGGTSFFEAVVIAQNKFLSVCLARNEHTLEGSCPFISAIEAHYLDESVYNSTDLEKNMLVTVARSNFGSDDDGIVSFPDDDYNRYWQPFNDENPSVSSHSSINPPVFWNLPPKKAFASALTTSRGKNLTLTWPPYPLPSGRYHIVLYFQDNRTPSPYSWRVFDVYVNEEKFYQALNVTDKGKSVYGNEWPLLGNVEINMVPIDGSPVGPLINAAEILEVLPIEGNTITRDLVAMEDLRDALGNTPLDWSGDPCLPKLNSWTGVSCSSEESARVNSLDLTGLGLYGSLPSSISQLTGLKQLLLGDNKLSGTLPDLSSLKSLEILHLENNQLEGSIPSSLGDLPNLHEIYLQNNKFNSSVPDSLAKKLGIILKV